MTIYIPMIILTVFLADIQERIRYRGRKISILLITLLPPTLVAAFRYNNGADYPMYFQLFTRLGNGSKIAGIQLFQSTHIFNRETGAMSQLAESSTKQWRLADTFVCGRGVPIGKFVRPYLHFKGKEQGRIDLTLTL